MPEPKPVPALLRLKTEYVPENFYVLMCNVVEPDKDQFIVKKITWYKEHSNKRHEFLIAQLQRIQGTDVRFAVVERRPSKTASFSQISKTPIPSPSASLSASDTIECFERDDKDALVRKRGADALITHKFLALPLLEFSRIIRTVSKHQEDYVITHSMCYWYVFMIVEVARRQYSSTSTRPNSTPSIRHILSNLNILPNRDVPPEVPPDTDVVPDLVLRAGYFRKINMDRNWKDELNIVEKKYEDARSADPNPIPPSLLERFGQEREQGRAEGLERGREERREVERLKADAERAKADAERAKADAERERQLRLKTEEQLRALQAQ